MTNRSHHSHRSGNDDDRLHLDPDDELPAPDSEGLAPDEPETPVSDAPEPEGGSRRRAPEDPSEMKDRWLRAEAEFQNYKRRAQRELEEARRAADDPWLLRIIELLDDLDRAIESARTEGAPPSWLRGVDLVAQRMRDLLVRSGVEPITAAGAPFDPHVHEALMEVDAPKGQAPGTIAQVIRPGWARGTRVLRPARVAVAREPVERPR